MKIHVYTILCIACDKLSCLSIVSKCAKVYNKYWIILKHFYVFLKWLLKYNGYLEVS